MKRNQERGKAKGPDSLRRRAERLLSQKAKSKEETGGGDTAKLVHELQVHQIELEMQNEVLRKAQAEVEKSRSRYFDLYDFAPVGYFTFDQKGMILEANLAGAKLLGSERSLLLRLPFIRFLSPESRSRFHRHLKAVFSTGAKETCELKLIRGNGDSFYVSVESISSKDSEGTPFQCRSALIDITERKRAEEELQKAHDELEIRVQTRTEELVSLNKVLENEIAERKRAEQAVQEAREYAESVIATVREPLVVLGTGLRVVSTNRSFHQMFGVKQEETYGRLIYELGNRQWDIPRLRELLEAILPKNTTFDDFEVDHDFPAIGRRIMLLNGRRLYREANRTELILLAIEDITERKREEETLKNAHAELEKRIQERTSELSESVERLQVENIQRKQLEDTLRQSEYRVRFFASQCLTAQETERKRVAGELHDSIAASLGAMRFRIEKIAEEMKQGHVNLEALQDLGSIVGEINNEVRRIMADLRPSVLDDLGIVSAMNWLCREYQKTYPHISLESEIVISEQDVPDSLKTPIFRICQEAMNNIAKHSKATVVNLTLQKGSGIELVIRDNGQGFDLDTTKRGMGLSTMRERAQLSGGSFDLESIIGQGTAIRISWPL